MRVNNYQIGRYYGIIKKIYNDGSYDYETSFSDKDDLGNSIFCCQLCIGRKVGLASKNPKTLVAVEVFRGKEDIMKELSGKPALG